jgi:hypothetical protein
MVITTQKLSYNPSYKTPFFHNVKNKMKSLTIKTSQLNKKPIERDLAK